MASARAWIGVKARLRPPFRQGLQVIGRGDDFVGNNIFVQGIERCPVKAHFLKKVWSTDQAGCPDSTDLVTVFQTTAAFNAIGDPGKMGWA